MQTTYADGTWTLVTDNLDGSQAAVAGNATPDETDSSGIDAPYTVANGVASGGFWTKSQQPNGDWIQTWYTLLGQPYKSQQLGDNGNTQTSTTREFGGHHT